MTVLEIRRLTESDSAAAVKIFFDAIHIGTADTYSLEQRKAWAGEEPDFDGWHNRFKNLAGFVAEISGRMVGFMTLDDNGYIDLAFVSPESMGLGVGRKLYGVLETEAIAREIGALSTNASVPAKSFFQRMGWRVEREQNVAVRGESLTNYKMSKQLASSI